METDLRKSIDSLESELRESMANIQLITKEIAENMAFMRGAYGKNEKS